MAISHVEARKSKGGSLCVIDIAAGNDVLLNGGEANAWDACIVFKLVEASSLLLMSFQMKHTDLDAATSATISRGLFCDKLTKATTAMENCYYGKRTFLKNIFIAISNRKEGEADGKNDEADFIPEEMKSHQPKSSALEEFLETSKDPVGLVYQPNLSKFLTPTFDSFALLKQQKNIEDESTQQVAEPEPKNEVKKKEEVLSEPADEDLSKKENKRKLQTTKPAKNKKIKSHVNLNKTKEVEED